MTDPSKRILCVEDDRDAREMITIMLRQANSGSAAEALDLSGRKPFDLYVLDIWLPGMDGMSLCRRLRDRGYKTPIIFFSAMVRPKDREYGLAAGADEFLVKPADLDRFLPTVARLLLDDRPTAESIS